MKLPVAETHVFMAFVDVLTILLDILHLTFPFLVSTSEIVSFSMLCYHCYLYILRPYKCSGSNSTLTSGITTSGATADGFSIMGRGLVRSPMSSGTITPSGRGLVNSGVSQASAASPSGMTSTSGVSGRIISISGISTTSGAWFSASHASASVSTSGEIISTSGWTADGFSSTGRGLVRSSGSTAGSGLTATLFSSISAGLVRLAALSPIIVLCLFFAYHFTVGYTYRKCRGERKPKLLIWPFCYLF